MMNNKLFIVLLILVGSTCVRSTHDVPVLFKLFPSLEQHIAYLSLADLPTPIESAPTLAQLLHIKELYIKRDDLTGKVENGHRLFGGSKIRKLEFLLADAVAQHKKTVLTFGSFGSHHAFGTAFYAQRVGLKSIIMLKPQPASSIVRRNLLLYGSCDTELNFYPTALRRYRGMRERCLEHYYYNHEMPYVIPTGGATPLGVLGYINAACELKKQIDDNSIMLPDVMYVPMGSAGTIVGLLIGCALTGMDIEIVGVAVEPEEYDNFFITCIEHLYNKTVKFLQQYDQKFFDLDVYKTRWRCIFDESGVQYGLGTENAKNAIKMMYEHQGLIFDVVYSGKACAGLISDARKQILTDKRVLLWSTFCSDDFSHLINKDMFIDRVIIKTLSDDIDELLDRSIPEENRLNIFV